MPLSAKTRLATLLSAVGLVALASAPASAQTTREVYYATQASWTVQSVFDASNVFQYCAAQQAGGAGFVRISRDPTTWALGISSVSNYDQAQVTIDSLTANIGLERLHDQWNYTILEGDALAAVRNGLSMQLRLNTGAVYAVTLRGSTAAMRQTEQCMQQNVNRTAQTALTAQSSAPATVAAPRQQPATPARQPQPAAPARQPSAPQAQPQLAAPSPIVTGAPQPVAGQTGTAPTPAVGNTAQLQAPFCAQGERYVRNMQICSGQLDVLIRDSDPNYRVAAGCELVTNASRFPSPDGQRFLIYRGLLCSNGMVAEIEAGVGAHGGSMRLVQEPSQMGWSDRDFARFAFVGDQGPAQTMYDVSLADAPASAAQSCNLYLLSDLRSDETRPNTYAFTQYHGPDPAMNNMIAYGGDCGPYGSYDDTDDYWQTIGDHVVFFTFGQDAFPDVDVRTFTMVDMDANGGLTVIQ